MIVYEWKLRDEWQNGIKECASTFSAFEVKFFYSCGLILARGAPLSLVVKNVTWFILFAV